MRVVSGQIARLSSARLPNVRVLLAGLLVALAAVGCTTTTSPNVSASRSPSPAEPTSSASPPPSADPASRAAAVAAKLSDVDLAGQVLMPSVSLAGDRAAALDMVRRYRLGGVILMGDVENTTASGTAEQVRALTDELRSAATVLTAADGTAANLLVGTDQEYGWVTRIKSGVVQLPSAMAFGAAARPDLTEAAWRGAGAELAAIGVDVDFAPSADLLATAGNYIIGSRSYGSDPTAVGAQVAAAVRGLQTAGVAAGIKHFPGHGRTTVNSHEALPVLGQSLASLGSLDLPPFQSGIDAGAWMVMSGHLDVRSIEPGLPATFSRRVLIDLLRTQMGFTGVVVTDALNMAPAKRWPPGEAAVRALIAGNDLLLMPPDLAAARKGVLDALRSGDLPRARLVEAVTRVLTLKFRVAEFDRPEISVTRSAAHRDAALAVAAASMTVLRGPCVGPLLGGAVRVTASVGRSQQAAWLTTALREQGMVISPTGAAIHLVGYGDSRADLAANAAVTVTMDTPYLLSSATSSVRVAAYSSTQVAMEALAAVIAGKARAAGRSPVAVSGLPRSACDG